MNGKQLKNSILQWAIQGKLVPQDPNDEPASVLLEKIRQEKERLIKEKKIKRDKNASIIYRGEDNSYYEKFTDGKVVCVDEEIPFDIPQGWEWCRLSCITSILGDGIHGTPEYDNTGDIYFVNGNNLNDGIITIKDDTKRVNSTEAAKQKRTLTESTVLVSINGTIGKVAFYNNEKIILGKSACYFNLLGCINKVYVKCIIETEYFSEYAKKVATGTTIKNVPLAGMRNFLIPLPSLSEQSRIVHRMSELKTKVSRYNHLQSELDILNHSIFDKLKKSALQEAIQGRLVPQIEEEGTAQELFEQIQQEKQRLVMEGKLKKSALYDSIISKGDDNKYYEQIGDNLVDITDDIPFNIPNNWVWTRIGYLFAHNNGKQLNKGNSAGTLMEYITTSNLYWDGFRFDHLKMMPFEESEIERCQAIKGDLLVCEGGDVGRSCIWDYDFPIMLQNHIHKLRPYIDVCTKFFYYIFYLYNVTGVIGGKGIGIQGFSAKALHNTLVPLPPLQEQQRIVAQIEKLFEQLI